MGTKRTDEFRADAVRIALTSGLTRKQVASGLGVGVSTLNKWIITHRDTEVVPDKDLDLARENERLRRENRILNLGPGSSVQGGCHPSRKDRSFFACSRHSPKTDRPVYGHGTQCSLRRAVRMAE